MTVRRRGGRWHYDFMIKHKRYRGVVPEARTKAQAERAETQIRQDIYDSKYGKAAAPIFENFVKEVYIPWAKVNKRSWRSDVEHTEVLTAEFGEKRLDEITPAIIEKFKSKRRESITKRGKTRAPASVNRELEVLSRIFTLAADQDKVTVNPCRKVNKLLMDNARTRYLSVEEEESLLKVMTGRLTHLRPIIIIAIDAGLRRRELLSLEIEQVDFTLNVINVKRTKSGKGRTVPMTQRVAEELKRLCEDSDSQYVFANPETGKAITDVKHSFTSAVSDAELKDLTFHDLRHTFGTRLAASGADVVKIKELMGHSSITTTMRYMHASDSGKHEAIARMAARHAQKDCHKIVTNEKRQDVSPALNS
jgi:integrase